MKQSVMAVDAESYRAGLEKLLLAETYAEDGAHLTALERMRQGAELLMKAPLVRGRADPLAALDLALLTKTLAGAVRNVCALKGELKRRGIALVVDLERGEIAAYPPEAPHD